MADIRTEPSTSLPEPLTDREREILTCLVGGLSNKEIAAQLHLALRTVKWYNSQIYNKLGVSNRKGAVEQAGILRLLNEASDNQESIPRNNLPVQPTRFIGRQSELISLANLVADPTAQIVTILAPGGMGKTRLALAAARHQLHHFRDGVFFVSLAPLRSSDDILTAIADQVGFSFYGSAPPQQQLLDYLRERRVLLVLDNFEHLLEGTRLVAEMVQAASGVQVLATSRERLNLLGEMVYVLRGLDSPTGQMLEHIQEYDTVKLFLQSAQRSQPGFALQAVDVPALVQICRLTDGMPLALELAAGWLDVLSLEQIAHELHQGIDILETDLRDVPERHRSVRATFEGTWSRLTDDERAVFARLSVFRGGFTLAAAQAVAGASARHLRGMAQKALIQTESGERFAIHELLRQFAAEKLAASGEQAAIQSRQTVFFANFMVDRQQDIRTDRQLEALALIDPDFENVRSAWLDTINQQNWDALPKFLHSLWFYLDVRSRGQEAIALFESAVRVIQSMPTSENSHLALGRVLARLGWFYNDIGFSVRNAEISDEAIRILRQYDSPEDLIMALHGRQMAADFLAQWEVSLRIFKEALVMTRVIGDKGWEGQFLTYAGLSAYLRGDYELALQCAEASLAAFETLGDRWGFLHVYGLFGYTKAAQNEYEQASQWLQQAQTLAEAFGHVFSIAIIYINQGKVAIHAQKYTVARTWLRKSLQVFRDAGYQWMMPFPLAFVAQTLSDQQEFERAVEILATIEKYPLIFAHTDEIAQTLRDELEAKLEPNRFASAWEQGAKRELSTLVAELLLKPSFSSFG
jgi:predicted ATPase/DNA-binding CsgD family transcriptional regulator/predicted negative regulator of RcsB-dependent stress response